MGKKPKAPKQRKSPEGRAAWGEFDRLHQLTGRRIHEMRTAAGVSQAELAARMNTTQARVSEWERGVHVPMLETLYDIAVQLNGDPHELDPRLCPKGK